MMFVSRTAHQYISQSQQNRMQETIEGLDNNQQIEVLKLEPRIYCSGQQCVIQTENIILCSEPFSSRESTRVDKSWAAPENNGNSRVGKKKRKCSNANGKCISIKYMKSFPMSGG